MVCLMKILHTSDWHLGRNGFGQFSLLEDQEAFIQWLISFIGQHNVDLVAIAGDIYDRAIAPPEAVRLFDRALTGIRESGAEVAAIAGNHDSADRFAVYSPFTSAAGVVLRGGMPEEADVVIREYADGPLAIVAVPYLDPRMVGQSSPLLADHLGPLTHDVLVGRCLEAAKEAIPSGMRSLVLSHGWVAGGTASESERDITVGGLGHVAAGRFDSFSYTALGHLHRPQPLKGRSTVRYSGSPLPYSFSETDPKSVELVHMDATGACEVSTHVIPVGRSVLTVRGTFEGLLQLEPNDQAFVKAELTDAGPVRDAKRRLTAVFPFLAEISLIGQQGHHGQKRAVQTLKAMSTTELITAFLSETTGSEPSEEELDIILGALSAVAEQELLDEAAA